MAASFEDATDVLLSYRRPSVPLSDTTGKIPPGSFIYFRAKPNTATNSRVGVVIQSNRKKEEEEEEGKDESQEERTETKQKRNNTSTILKKKTQNSQSARLLFSVMVSKILLVLFVLFGNR